MVQKTQIISMNSRKQNWIQQIFPTFQASFSESERYLNNSSTYNLYSVYPGITLHM